MSDTGQRTTRLLLKCFEPNQCSVVFEPYGCEVVLGANDEIRLWIVSNEEPTIEIGYSPGCITVWLPIPIISVSATNRLDVEIDLGLPL